MTRAITSFAVWVTLATTCAVAGCGSRQPYVRPTTVVPTAFKESANWKSATPHDDEWRGPWWEMFGDRMLNDLEHEVDVSNETLRTAEAQYEQAHALIGGARASLYPQITASPTIQRAQLSGTRAVSTFHQVYGDFLVPGSASYEADLWGRVHASVSASESVAQASAGDLASARLTVEADLAIDFFTLRRLDSEKALLDSTVSAYERALELTQNRFRGGLASESDVAQAETQLYTTQAQALDVTATRALFEHAIALLVGKSPAAFSLPADTIPVVLPRVPLGLPSDLLERRPDIAASERRVAAANAQVGVASAAFYPILTLGGTNGFESSSVGSWLAGASNLWSVGPALLYNVFDAGRRRAAVVQSRAAMDQAAATYQGVVLSAFREVEDQLATLRILEDEAAVQDRAVDSATRALTQATNRYRGGLVSYLEVITAQSALLVNQRTALDLQMRRVNATVLLLKGIGGGWNRASLPSRNSA
jgi:NodT family efflux transporter outer membrane factor (OMF) lipoprotein